MWEKKTVSSTFGLGQIYALYLKISRLICKNFGFNVMCFLRMDVEGKSTKTKLYPKNEIGLNASNERRDLLASIFE